MVSKPILRQDVVTVPIGVSKIVSLLPGAAFERGISVAWMIAKGTMSFGSSTVDTVGAEAGLPLVADDDVIVFVSGRGADSFYVKAAVATQIQVIQFG